MSIENTIRYRMLQGTAQDRIEQTALLRIYLEAREEDTLENLARMVACVARSEHIANGRKKVVRDAG